MNSPFAALRLASILAGLIGLAHLLRVVTEAGLVVGNYPVPPWASIFAAAIAWALAVWFWRLGTERTTRP